MSYIYVNEMKDELDVEELVIKALTNSGYSTKKDWQKAIELVTNRKFEKKDYEILFNTETEMFRIEDNAVRLPQQKIIGVGPSIKEALADLNTTLKLYDKSIEFGRQVNTSWCKSMSTFTGEHWY